MDLNRPKHQTSHRETLSAWMATIGDLRGAVRLLDWDRETVMPAAGAEARGQMAATLSALRHREVVRPEIDDVIEAIEAAGDLTERDVAILRLARRERRRAVGIPEALVRSLSEASSRSVSQWLEIRAGRGSFASYAPILQQVVDLSRETGAAIGIGEEPYDALLDDFEPGATTRQIAALFTELVPALAEVAAAIPSDQTNPGAALAGRGWPDDQQMAVAHDVARTVGFDFDSGYVSVSTHPFTDSPHLGDVRFTTRISPDDPTANVLVVLHEAGHAMYAQGLDPSLAGTLAFATPSLGADESQSRFFENHVGRRLAFWEAVHPTFTSRFPSSMDGLTPGDLQRAVGGVRRHWSRVDSDEVTYDLHIALRFELELALIRGALQVADLPDAWAEASQRLLGLTPGCDMEGCLQDIHWAWGLFGYFPTYTLGNIYAAQLAEAFEATIGPLDDVIRAGEFQLILSFMRDRVHRRSSLDETPALMAAATGAPFSTGPLLRRITALVAPWR